MNLSSLQVIICLFLRASLAFEAEIANDDDESNFEVKENYEKIYERLELIGFKRLEPQVTLIHLRSLETQCLAEDTTEKSCHDVSNLVKAADVNQEKCQDYSVTHMAGLILIDRCIASKMPNLVNYMQHYRTIQYKICSPLLVASLKEKLKNIPLKYSNSIEQLKRIMIEKLGGYDKKLFRETQQRLLVEGTVLFLEQSYGPLERIFKFGENSQDIYRDIFDEAIRRPCSSIMKHSYAIINAVRIVSKDDSMAEQLDPFLRGWLEDFNICLRIFHSTSPDGFQVYKGGYNLLTRHKESLLSRALSKCANCFNA